MALMNTEHFKAQESHMSLQGCLTSSVSPCYSSTSQLSFHLPERTELTIQGQESAPPRHTFVSKLTEGLARHHCLKIKVRTLTREPQMKTCCNISSLRGAGVVCLTEATLPTHIREKCAAEASPATMQPSNIRYFFPQKCPRDQLSPSHIYSVMFMLPIEELRSCFSTHTPCRTQHNTSISDRQICSN